MAIQISTRLKAEVIKGVIDQLTGGNTAIIERENSVKLILSEQQKKWLTAFVDAQLEMKRRPDVEIDILGILLPVLWKRVWPFLALAGGGVSVLALKAFSGKRRR